jgi:hypothetical protein
MEDHRGLVSLGTKELRADHRLDGGAVTEALRWIKEDGGKTPDPYVRVSVLCCLSDKFILLLVLMFLFVVQP